jgi:hypothetical protein
VRQFDVRSTLPLYQVCSSPINPVHTNIELLSKPLRSPGPLRLTLLRRVGFTAVLATLACAKNELTASQLEVVDSAGVRITSITVAPESLPVWTLDTEPRHVLTGAETGDETAFAFIGPVKFLANGGMVIGDVASGRLIVYDARGAFVRFHGRRGEGPAEMRRLESITLKPGDTLATFDPGLRRLSFWHPDTGFLRIVVLQVSTTPQNSVPPGTGVRRWPTRAQLTLRGASGSIVNRSATFDGMYTGLSERGDIRLPFSNRPFVALAPDRAYLGSGNTFEITSLDRSLQLTDVIRWPAREEPLTSSEVDAVRAEAIALISRRPLPPNLFADHFAAELLPAKRPAIGRVFVDRDGRLWIERYEATRMGTAVQKPGDQWSILRDDGMPIAIFRLPPSTRLEDVRGDEVVVVRRDSLDVQSVAVYRVKR